MQNPVNIRSLTLDFQGIVGGNTTSTSRILEYDKMEENRHSC